MMNDQQRKTLALGLIAAGALFFFGDIFNFNFGGSLWPIFVMAPGLVFLYVAYTGDRSKAGFIYPGLIIAGTGAILLYQNATDHWSSWAYIWTLYPVFVGLGQRFQGERLGDDKQIETGKQMVTYGIIAFGVGFAFFELLIFGGFGSFSWILIGLGIAILVLSGKKSVDDDSHISVTNGRKAKIKNDESYPVV